MAMVDVVVDGRKRTVPPLVADLIDNLVSRAGEIERIEIGEAILRWFPGKTTSWVSAGSPPRPRRTLDDKRVRE